MCFVKIGVVCEAVFRDINYFLPIISILLS